jgi:ribosome-associated protein
MTESMTEPMSEDTDVDEQTESDPVIASAGGSADARHWASRAAAAAASKTDADTVVLEVAPVMAIVEYFVITAGRNPRQVRTLADEIEEQLARAGGPKPKRIEGRDALQWLLMDYGDFVVHVFHEEMRTFYALEKLWADVPRVDWRAEVGAGAADAVGDA